MKNYIFILLLSCVLMFALSPQISFADDVFVPSWRGTYGTVVAGCSEWSQEDANYDGTGAIGIGSETNPGWSGTTYPLPWVKYHNGHRQFVTGRDSVIEIEPDGYIAIGLPNYSGGFQKTIILQVTTLGVGTVGDVEVWGDGFDPNDFPWPQSEGAPLLHLLQTKDHGDGWITSRYGLYLEPNPSSEVIKLNYGVSTWIDQIVIDTICLTVPDDTKWEQLPDKAPTGMDICIKKEDDPNRIVADDFLCTTTGPITDIEFWGSWKNDLKGTVDKIYLSIYSDIPAGQSPSGWSTPGTQLWSMDITNFTEALYYDLEDEYEWWYDPYLGTLTPNADQQIWKYSITIDPNDAFVQQGTFNQPLVYWLAISAEISGFPPRQFGWKTRDPNDGHFNDDAVFLDPFWLNLTYTEPHPLSGDSIDMAFTIKTKRNPQMDLGDAPDSSNSYDPNTMTAYPGVQANFPTIYRIGSPPFGSLHLQPKTVAFLGSDVSFELEADILADDDGINNITPVSDTSNLDGFDDGVSPLPDLPYCRWITFDYTVNVATPGTNLYANVWFDWTRDGDWDDTPTCPCCTSGPAPEWAVKNQFLYNLPAGKNTITSTGFRTWHPDPNTEKDIWMRISLSEQPWTFEDYTVDPNGVAGSGPPAGYLYGETEDYFYKPVTSCTECANLNCDDIIDLEDFAIFAQQWLKMCDE